jgi:predicted tellurium resistance membrane protein TerC
MEKYNKLEIIGFVLLVIGGFFWLSEEFFVIESLSSFYSYLKILFWLGLLIWAIGYMPKEKAKRDKAKLDSGK